MTVICPRSKFQCFNAASSAQSVEPPSRVTPTFLPLSCAGCLISGRDITEKTRLFPVLPINTKSAPRKDALITGTDGP